METLNQVVHEYKEISPLTAFFSLQTCGEACWHARESVCHCYCGGKNHGCLKTANGVAPTRMAKIDGYMYQIKSIGKWNELLDEADKINKLHPYNYKSLYGGESYERFYHETESGAWGRMKPATTVQCEKWIELKQFYEIEHRRPYILWERVA